MRPLGLRPLLAACCLLTTFGCRADPGPADPLRDFPKTRVTITSASGSHVIQAWLANTPEHRSRGLMFVEKLPADTGMLFVYAPENFVSMWMKNTYVALDMLFIDRRGRIVNCAQDTKPLSLETIDSAAPVIAVLELPAGTVRRLQLQPGDRVQSTAFPL
jgi:uncharacterized membrane protein (UPF0127 family)